jgi:nucleotide-binding universal stress UspA family protein
LSRTILVALNDSPSSRAVINYLIDLNICTDETRVSLVHILIKPSAGDELMGKKFMEEQPVRLQSVLERARDLLAQCGIPKENIETRIVSEPCDTVADGIIDLFHKGQYDMVVIGRKKMSKAQEFVLGDPSIRLIRALEETMILVVKTG